MNNEPVAWMREENDSISLSISEETGNNWIPLYTHPAKLTDEDLMEIFYEMTALSKLHCEALTKAILRKASEK